jgi:hypothetical protein
LEIKQKIDRETTGGVLPSRGPITWLLSRIGGIDDNKVKTKQNKTLRFQDEEIEEEIVCTSGGSCEGL